MNIQDKIDNDFVTGAIRYKGKFGYFFMPPIYWVTDSDYYDPEYKEGDFSDQLFRDGVGKISKENAEIYLASIESDRINSKWISDNLAIYGQSIMPVFYLDIDNQLFVSHFFDLDYEEHVAPNWRGIYDDPLNHLPDDIKNIWQQELPSFRRQAAPRYATFDSPTSGGCKGREKRPSAPRCVGRAIMCDMGNVPVTVQTIDSE
jgi:hypothetical protein